MTSSRTFTLFFAPHSSNCRFSSLSVSGTKLAMVRNVSSRCWARAGTPPARTPTAPPAVTRRNCRRLTMSALLLDGAGRQSSHVVVEEEDVGDHDGKRADAGAGHQPAPVVDVAADQLGEDADRHRLQLGGGDEDERVEELVPRQRE